MIFDGVNGYVKGSLNVPVDTVLAMIKGPIKGKNWYNTSFDPTYAITISSGAAGAVALEGTNDVVYASNDDSRVTVSADILPAPNASWTTIQAGTSTSASGTITTSYWFLRLRVSTQGAGTVTNAWVSWN
jgi:hypothetical protein